VFPGLLALNRLTTETLKLLLGARIRLWVRTAPGRPIGPAAHTKIAKGGCRDRLETWAWVRLAAVQGIALRQGFASLNCFAGQEKNSPKSCNWAWHTGTQPGPLAKRRLGPWDCSARSGPEPPVQRVYLSLSLDNATQTTRKRWKLFFVFRARPPWIVIKSPLLLPQQFLKDAGPLTGYRF